MTITLATVKAEHSRLGEMIAKIEADLKKSAFFEFGGQRIPLEIGERYSHTIISADHTRNHHIILLPGEFKGSWQACMDWAKSIGGDLFDRPEGAVLFATMKDEFKPEWYWTREPHASDSDYAWGQGFSYGSQYGNNKSAEGRARAVRRLLVIQ